MVVSWGIPWLPMGRPWVAHALVVAAHGFPVSNLMGLLCKKCSVLARQLHFPPTLYLTYRWENYRMDGLRDWGGAFRP